MTVSPAATESLNIAQRLAAMAQERTQSVAVAFPRGYAGGKRQYDQVSFAELEADVTCLARGLVELGVTPGMRIALLVRPSIDFIALVFALFRAGAVIILIDPGMGTKSLLGCLTAAEPQGFVAISLVHAVRMLLARRFPQSRIHVTVGRRWFWGGVTLEQVRQRGAESNAKFPATRGSDPAAIIFTTGSTGPPKGVLYHHRTFDAQVVEIRERYGIKPGEVDLPGFPLFGLFNCAMGVTTVIPDMDPTAPSRVDPRKVLEAVRDWQVTQAFGSPAIWNRVGRYCQEHGETLPTLRRVLSAGAPVPAHVLARMKACIHPEGEIHTPYGATEALPVASIAASEVLGETASATAAGAGVCVGRCFSFIRWKVIRATEAPIECLDQAEELPTGEIGELIVCGPQVTRAYVTRTEWNGRAKIADGAQVWHRMGDVGYLDAEDRFWFCGRMNHRVLTTDGPLYSIRCEAIFNNHPAIYRTALVGIGPAGSQMPVIVAEPQPGQMPKTDSERSKLISELLQLGAGSPLTHGIGHILLHPSLPVDIRHNAKIFREKLAVWAATQLAYEPDSKS